MGDELQISGSGQSSVAVEELQAAAQQLGLFASEVAGAALQLALIDRSTDSVWWSGDGAPLSLLQAERRIEDARTLVGALEGEARTLAWGLTAAAAGYGFVDQYVRGLVGGVLGTVAGAPWLGYAIASGDLSTSLSHAGAVDLVQAAAMSMDDSIMGLLGVPWPIAQLIGENGLGLVGLPLAAGGIMAAGPMVGLLRETPVAIARVTPLPPSAPTVGFTQRFDRIPKPVENGGAQVVIEKYEIPGEEPQYSVFIAGTVTFDPVSDTEPWDMTSNMGNAAGPGSGSYDSVALAMEEAGITESSPVQFTGYSQGGGTAGQLAASGDYNTVGLVTFGGPTGQIDLPDDVPTVLVEHRDDIVPALGGNQDNTQAVIVERDVFDGRDIPSDVEIPAHHREYYRETAELMDGSVNSELASTLAQLDAVASDPRVTVTSTAYQCVRVSSSASEPGGG